MRPTRFGEVLTASLAYVVVGVVAAALAGSAGSPAGTKGWRLAAWILSLAIFVAHVVFARLRHRGTLLESAANVGLAVAVAAFVLAIVGPVRGHWSDPQRVRVAMLSVVLWPLLTGVPAFGAALAAGRVIERVARHPQ